MLLVNLCMCVAYDSLLLHHRARHHNCCILFAMFPMFVAHTHAPCLSVLPYHLSLARQPADGAIRTRWYACVRILCVCVRCTLSFHLHIRTHTAQRVLRAVAAAWSFHRINVTLPAFARSFARSPVNQSFKRLQFDLCKKHTNE